MGAIRDVPTILYLPCFDYHVHRQRPQQLLYQLSLLGFDVLYCNVTQDKTEPFLRLHERFTVCQDVTALDRDKPYIMWLTHGPYVEVLSAYRCRMVVGDIADICEEEFAPFAQWHDRKIAASDLVLCASQIIYDAVKHKHPNAVLLRNGADYDHFAAVTRPGVLPYEEEARRLCRTTAPVVGFWGAVASWLDYDLIRYLATKRPQYRFVFIGEISCRGPERMGPMQNVDWLGNVDYERLPAFARQFDVAILPFQVRKVTEAANPVKLYEYMAAGLPIVSTDLPEVRLYAGVRIGKTPDDFLRQLDEALLMDRTPQRIAQRQAVARRESWRSRAHIVAERILAFLREQQQGSGHSG